MKRVLGSRAFQITVSLALAALLAVFFLRQVDFARLGEALASASVGWLLVSVALALTCYAFRALRWTWLLRPVARVPFWPAFSATAIGFAANNLPGKVGEVLRPAALARSQRLPFSPLLASILLERVFDGVSVVFFFLIAAALGLPGGGGLGKLLIPAILLVSVVAVVVLAVFQRTRTERLLLKLCGWLPAALQPRARHFAETFVDGLASLKSPRLLLLIGGGSIAMWYLINLQILAVLRAFHLPLPVSAAFLVTSFAVLGLMFPTPGGLGSYHVAVQLALTQFYGVETNTASAAALLAHAVSFVPITLVGLVFLLASPARREAADAAPDAPGRHAGDPPEPSRSQSG